ncbi:MULTISPECIES: hypothetical protein [Pseudomonas]|nr:MULTISPECIES: hypothetical protein [Pseudomonas]MBV2079624.1 hypothetical protein [Pseudomonas carnis]MBV2085378.1 hypothetical protein [Pseudomonas carnis]MDO3689352.1 hypothetical protein [Pseudomonas sp. DKN 2791]MDO7031263.1 hypothetical protein [Pseudomonas sp. DKN 2792]
MYIVQVVASLLISKAKSAFGHAPLNDQRTALGLFLQTDDLFTTVGQYWTLGSPKKKSARPPVQAPVGAALPSGADTKLFGSSAQRAASDNR